MKSMNNRKRLNLFKLSILIISILLVCVLVYGIAFAVNQFVMEKRSQPDEINTDHLIYHFPDWEENIWEDEKYMEKDHTIFFQNGAETYPLADVKNDEKGASFFLNYIDALIQGDHAALNTMYTSEYTDKNGFFEPFTMQKVYDVLVSYKGTAKGVERYGEAEVFDLSYCIMENNGTFRRDIASDSPRTQIIYLVHTDDGYKIHEVSYYKNRVLD
ncbi:MAG: hypothetical protein HFE78_00970 [Clostridiales bacterium]|nr:hypothetical protein [Clostridiales bacterium]